MEEKHGTADRKEGIIWTPGQFVEAEVPVIRALHKALEGMDPAIVIDQLNRNGKTLVGGLKKIIDEIVLTNVYYLSVDYRMTIEELVKLGRYDWSDRDITSAHFPTQRTSRTKVLIEPIHFNRLIGSDEALRELDRLGYRPAELHELLAFGAEYPNIQREFPIIALGSMWQGLHGGRSVPFLDGDGSRRELRLIWFGGDWHGLCRFAAVRK